MRNLFLRLMRLFAANPFEQEAAESAEILYADRYNGRMATVKDHPDFDIDASHGYDNAVFSHRRRPDSHIKLAPKPHPFAELQRLAGFQAAYDLAVSLNTLNIDALGDLLAWRVGYTSNWGGYCYTWRSQVIRLFTQNYMSTEDQPRTLRNWAQVVGMEDEGRAAVLMSRGYPPVKMCLFRLTDRRGRVVAIHVDRYVDCHKLHEVGLFPPIS